MTIPVIQQKQSEILNEIQLIRSEQQILEQKVTELTNKIKQVEDNVASVLPLKAEVARLVNCSGKLSTACTNLQDYQDDLDNRSRRNNLIFFGIEDNQNETWAESESKILSFCSEKLQVPIASEAIERAHRLGRYTEAKNRPLIVKFLSFKDKQRVLTVTARLKGSQFAISEDYSNKVRLQRQKLIQFARQRGGNFKLNFNKLRMNGQLNFHV